MLIPIANASDPRVVEYRAVTDPDRLARSGLFVAETRFVVRRLLESSRYPVRSLLVTETARAGLEDVIAAAPPSLPVFVCSQQSMNDVAGVNIHRGCLAIGERPPRPVDAGEVVARTSTLLALEGVGNPDNIGSLFRSAAALGAGGVLLGPNCADPLYRKAIRTSMGATFRLPFADLDDWPGGLDIARRAGFRIVALTPDRSAIDIGRFATTMEKGSRTLVLVGSEGEGLSERALARADDRVRIPMAGTVDSLNVATAAAIALHRLCASAEETL